MKKSTKKSNALRSAGRFGAVRVNAVGYILVGGASSRFGRDKALVTLGGQPMYSRMRALLKSVLLWRICLVGDPAKYGDFGIACIPDLFPGEGPFGGILSALRDTETKGDADYNLVVSCDMPFLTADWIESLLTHAFENDAQVTLARSTGGAEPLCACWRTDALPTLQGAFGRGVRKVTDGIALLRAEVLDERDWKRFDSAGRLFWNMNTPADYEEARRIIEAEQG